jgi:VIT1/CCC1 family predicted Fe2+/Mn2+ transporter
LLETSEKNCNSRGMREQPPSIPSASSEIGHVHADISGGWLRAGVFGAMDGLVTNLALVAGVGAASESADIVVVTGIAGLVAGAFSMALGEYTSVATQNEQVDREVAVERAEIVENPDAEMEELAELFVELGMTESTAGLAAHDVHRDLDQAVLVHVTHELGLDPEEKPSPVVAAVSSFLMFSVGALVPLLPYLFGLASLTAGLLAGAVGLLVAGAAASVFTVTSWWRSALRQLLFGAIAVAATYTVGSIVGVGIS